MARYPADVYLYLGAGSLPLLPAETLTSAITEVGQAIAPTAVTNNLHSSDWMVLNCPEPVAARVQRLATDNALGWVLRTEAGVAVRSLPPSAGTRLDIDTPADLLLLALHPHIGPALQHYLRAQPRDTSRWLAAGRRLFTPGGQVALIGRISSGVWAHIEANTQAWIRVFSEERGMSASGRLAAGQVKSLLAAQLVQLGPTGFFRELSQIVEAVFFDTRVVLAHAAALASAADRCAARPGPARPDRDAGWRAYPGRAGGAIRWCWAAMAWWRATCTAWWRSRRLAACRARPFIMGLKCRTFCSCALRMFAVRRWPR